MWPFSRKKSLLDQGLLRGWTDWHSHILPGVDDGVRTMDDSLGVLRWYAEQGVREVWLTPHVMEDCPNAHADLRERFAVLQAAWDGPVALHLAAEHMLDALFEQRFAVGDVLPLGPSGDRLLVETSCFNAPFRFEETLEEIRTKGFHPVLAHPERYLYLDDAAYRRIHGNGVEFQLNLPSLAGSYGPEPARRARMLLEAGLYTYAGSDLHRLSAFQHAVQKPIKPLPSQSQSPFSPSL